MSYKVFRNESTTHYIFKSINVKAGEKFYPKTTAEEAEAIEFASTKGKGFFIPWEGGDVIIQGNDFYANRIKVLETENANLTAEIKAYTKQIHELSQENLKLNVEVAKLNSTLAGNIITDTKALDEPKATLVNKITDKTKV